MSSGRWRYEQGWRVAVPVAAGIHLHDWIGTRTLVGVATIVLVASLLRETVQWFVKVHTDEQHQRYGEARQ